MEDMHLNIGQVLAEHAVSTPDAPAIVAPGRVPLSYAGLAAHIDDVGATLRAAGIERYDRVALVLPTGPEMAVNLLAIASWAVCAPLSPSYQEQEYAEYLTTLKVRAVMVQTGAETDAVVAASERLQLSVIRISPLPDASAGLVALDAIGQLVLDAGDRAQPDDVAIILLTSGTTSRSKVVPLSHRNLCAWGRHMCHALRLIPDDRCLDTAPASQAHGLVFVLASLEAVMNLTEIGLPARKSRGQCASRGFRNWRTHAIFCKVHNTL